MYVNTVDGRNPTPVDMVVVSHSLRPFIHPNGGCLGFLSHQHNTIHCELIGSLKRYIVRWRPNFDSLVVSLVCSGTDVDKSMVNGSMG